MSSLGPASAPEPIQGIHHASRISNADPDKKREQEQKKKRRPHDEVDLSSLQSNDASSPDDQNSPDADADTPLDSVKHLDING